MGVKYDMESLLDDVKAAMVSHFNTVVGEINTEKNDTIVLDTLNADAYILQSMNGKLANWNPLCLYGVENIESSSRGPLHSSKFTLSVMIIAIDTGEDIECGKRMFRYSRALEEVFRRGWNGGQGGVKLEVKSLVPIPFTDLNTSERYRVVGVALEGNLG